MKKQDLRQENKLLRSEIKRLKNEIESWKFIANDLWWWLDNYGYGRDAQEALDKYPELAETESYLHYLVHGTMPEEE